MLLPVIFVVKVGILFFQLSSFRFVKGILFPIVNRLGLTTSNLFNVEPDENEEEINRFLGKFRACSRANQMVLLNMLDFLAEQLLGLQEGNNEDH